MKAIGDWDLVEYIDIVGAAFAGSSRRHLRRGVPLSHSLAADSGPCTTSRA